MPRTSERAVEISPVLAAVPSPASAMGRLGSWSYRHRRVVLAGWLLALIVVSGIGQVTGSRFSDSITGGSTESDRAATLLSRTFPSEAGGQVEVVFHSRPGTPVLTSAAPAALIAADLTSLDRLPGVAGYNETLDRVSRDGRTEYATVELSESAGGVPHAEVTRLMSAARGGASGLEVEFVGQPVENVEKPKFGAAEGLGILAAMLILLLAFGSVVAMLLPIACAVVAVATTFGVLDVLSHALTVPTFAPELAALVGLGVGIDYALFVVTRFRTGLADGQDPESAVATAMDTSGRAVLFAGSTVVLSLLGLLLLGLPFIYGAALGAVTAVLLGIAASLTLLPAALGFAGANVDRLHIGRARRTRDRPGFWWSWSRRVQRRPLTAVGVTLAILLVLAGPLFAMRLAFTDAGTDPPSFTSRHAYDQLAQAFGPGSSGPLLIVAELPGAGSFGAAFPAAGTGDPANAVPTGAALTRLSRGVGALEDVLAVSGPRFNADHTAAVFTVVPRTAPQDAATTSLVHSIRDKLAPTALKGSEVRALIGGQTAASIDTSAQIGGRLALVISLVILLSVVLLSAAFRSVVIPLASAIMTLLSTGAAYGIMVAVFEWGWLGRGIDNGVTAPVDPWVPVMLFALLFGLSMDYQVFLVSRIREARRTGQSESDAVAEGLAATGRVVTSAAAIMVCVFGAFVLGDLRLLRLFGFAMASAILLDATLVRMILMPATLQLFGRRSWWFPVRSPRPRH
jgi:RND superfamily putative drug exporter